MGKANKHKKNKKKQIKNVQNSSNIKMKNTGLTKKQEFSFIIFLLAVIFFIYSPIIKNEFVRYDDRAYVSENPYITNLNTSSVKHLFTEFYRNQYSPVAMSIIGLQFKISDSPGFIKLFSIIWHLAITLLVYIFLKGLFKKPEYILIPTILFAIHPMQVESVAWTAASFKTGPYAFFFLASLISYNRFITNKKIGLYLLSLLLFILACLSKEQAIVLSLVLFLIDFLKGRNLLNRKLLMEKIPFIILSFVFGIITIQASNSTVDSTSFIVNYGFFDRLFIANYTFIAYLGKLLIPIKQSAYYLYPLKGSIPSFYYGSIIMTIGLLVAVFYAKKKNNHLVVFGSLFFLLNIGLALFMQVLGTRDVMMAERYLYIASIGIFIILVSLSKILIKKFSISPKLVYLVLIIYTLLLSYKSFERTKVWKNSNTIFSDIIDKETNRTGKQNPALSLAYNEIGVSKIDEGDLKAALINLNQGIKINPNYSRLYTNKGNVYFESGDLKRAIVNYSKSIELNSKDNPKAFSGRCAAYGSLGQYELALSDITMAIKQDPDDESSYQNRAVLNIHTKKLGEALADANKYIELEGDVALGFHLRGEIYRLMSDWNNSVNDLSRAIQLSPKKGQYYYSRAMTYHKMGSLSLAKIDVSKAQSLGFKVPPDFIRELNN